MSRYAVAIAFAALFASLGGLAWAPPRITGREGGPNSVGATQIKTGAVGSTEIKNGTIKKSDLAIATRCELGLLRGPQCRGRAPAPAPPGPQGLPGAPGAAGLAGAPGGVGPPGANGTSPDVAAFAGTVSDLREISSAASGFVTLLTVPGFGTLEGECAGATVWRTRWNPSIVAPTFVVGEDFGPATDSGDPTATYETTGGDTDRQTWQVTTGDGRGMTLSVFVDAVSGTRGGGPPSCRYTMLAVTDVP